MVHSLMRRMCSALVVGSAVVGAGALDVRPSLPMPTLVAALSADSAANRAGGASGCVTPRFTMTLTPIGPGQFQGVLTGDLAGWVVITFVGPFKFTGVTFANGGEGHWEITSGLGDGIVVFDTTFANRNQETVRPGSPGDLFENIGRHRAVDGVVKANLTYLGEFDASIPEGVHHYHGVICP